MDFAKFLRTVFYRTLLVTASEPIHSRGSFHIIINATLSLFLAIYTESYIRDISSNIPALTKIAKEFSDLHGDIFRLLDENIDDKIKTFSSKLKVRIIKIKKHFLRVFSNVNFPFFMK